MIKYALKKGDKNKDALRKAIQQTEKDKRCFVERCKILEFEALKAYSDKERELRLEETMRKHVRRPDPKDEAYYAQYIKSK